MCASVLVYGNKTGPMKAEEMRRLEKTERLIDGCVEWSQI